MPLVMADPVQLQQVILNVIMNAVEAMRQSGDSARILRLSSHVNGAGSVVMKVADSGPSVDPKVAEKMFQPFFTTKSGGMGMGLTICKTMSSMGVRWPHPQANLTEWNFRSFYRIASAHWNNSPDMMRV